MLKYIEKLQKEPEHVRRGALYIIMGVLMLIVVSVWITTLSFRFGISTGTKEGDTASTTSPFTVLKESAAFLLDGVSEVARGVKSVLDEVKNGTSMEIELITDTGTVSTTSPKSGSGQEPL